MDSFNERTTIMLTLAFTDEVGAPVTPDTASCRIDDRLSGRVVRATTAISSLAPSTSVIVTADENRLVSDRNREEERIVTVEFTYNTGRRGTQEYRYRLKNLTGVTT